MLLAETSSEEEEEEEEEDFLIGCSLKPPSL
jgi:hypothetical protein